LIMLLIIYYPVELSYLYRPGQYFVWTNLTNITYLYALGLVIYTHFATIIIMSCGILLIAMMGAIILTYEVRFANKLQDIGLQLRR
jgi:NADH:ubiquinone oxidoreductase subunit 6 (subunit J)